MGQEPFIAREQGPGTRLAYEAFFRRHGTELKMRMEIGSKEAIEQTVAGRLDVSILSRSAMQAELASGETIAVVSMGVSE